MTKTIQKNLEPPSLYGPIESCNIKSNYKNTESFQQLQPHSQPTTIAEKQIKDPESTRENFWRDMGHAIKLIQQLSTNQSTHTKAQIHAAGFSSIENNNDLIRCLQCQIEISGLTKEMDLFKEHKIRSPACPYVKKMTFNNEPIEITTGKPQKLQKTETMTCVGDATSKQNINKQKNVNLPLYEVESLREGRKRSFSHWVHKNPSQSQMIEAGFFNCNVGDRVICLYCNIICQQWIPYKDDPIEIHKSLSPNCPYVKLIQIKNASMNSICILNGTDSQSSQTTSVNSNNSNTANGASSRIRSNEIVLTAACNQQYIELPKRSTSFTTWPTDPLPSVDDLVKAGFFYTGTKTIVTCFYCNGSLQNWGPKDNPTIEHARWFPQCSYARQLCGDDLYRKIQESKQAAQERSRLNEQQQTKGFSISNINETSNNTSLTNNGTQSNSRKLQIPDEATLSRLVAARLDLPSAKSLLNKGIKLSIIKRCLEDQLRLKHDDFICDSDLLLACTILQKQIEYIDGKKENIIVPSVHTKKVAEQAEKERAGKETLEQNISSPNSTEFSPLPMTLSSSSSMSEDADMTTSLSSESPMSSSPTSSIDSNPLVKSTDEKSKSKADSPIEVSNPCVLCLTDEKRLACIPCGHLATCVPCGHSLRTCPICRKQIEAFVRIYI